MTSSKHTRAHCNTCGGERNHGVLHSEKTSWSDDEHPISGSDEYETLKCLGCDSIELRHTSYFSEDYDGPTITYFPPAMFRQQPTWFKNLFFEIPQEDDFVEPLLQEIYVALQNNQPRLAAMGVRSLIETIMIAKTGDNGTFAKNISEFENLGYVSTLQRERMEAILEAGHAAIHRAFEPRQEDIITLLDITEHIIETVYLHKGKVDKLKKRVPAKKSKKANKVDQRG
ncbi:MAG: DUF4145 domain-containing protein [Gammaproteobacteria bacterium]|nr:DUF4145 domain-containing protein [Gammaproteobacteria bacterium]MCF6260802.1 DUF4145 domain-containing protein [Gammaproteobacteria bacterium]